MAKLHEALAIHKDRAGVVKKVIDEARGVFKTAAHFQGHVKVLTYFDQAENMKFARTEEKKVDETVMGKLNYVNGHMRKLLDLDYQIDRANQAAVADLVVEGMMVAQAVPVATLLTLENKLKEYRAMLDMVPTHAPGVEWVVDDDQATDGSVLRSSQVMTEYLTKKVPVSQITAPATEQHPAQVNIYHEDVRVAKVDSTRYTATISPAQKSDLLGRCDSVIQSCKRARQRANGVALPNDKMADRLLMFIVNATDIPSRAIVGSEEGEAI